MSANGATVAFTHDDTGGTSLAQGDANGRPDVLAATLAPTDATGPQFALPRRPRRPAAARATQLVQRDGGATRPASSA